MATTPNSPGMVDQGLDTPDDVKAMGSHAEADAIIRNLLGLDLSVFNIRDKSDRDRMAAEITRSTFNIVRQTRVSITEAHLEDILKKNLDDAMKLCDDRSKVLNRDDISRIAAGAIYETFPKDLSRELLRQRFAFTAEKQPIGKLKAKIDLGGNRDVVIDMTNAFWVSQPYRSADELRDALDGKVIGKIGMEITGLQPSHTLTAAEAQKIAESVTTANDAWTVTELKGEFRTLREDCVLPNGMTIQWGVDIDALLKAKAGARDVADLNRDELVAHFDAMPVPEWNALIGNQFPPPPLLAPFVVDPIEQYPRTLAKSWAATVAEKVFERLQRPATEKLGRHADLHQLQQYQRRQYQMNQIYTRAQTSENAMGAMATASILSQDPSLAERFPTLDKTKTDMLKNDIEKIKYAQKMIDELKSVQANLTSIGKSFAASIADLSGLNTTGPASSSSQDRDKWKNQVDQLNKDIAEYNKVARSLQNVFNALNAAGLDGTKMGTYMTTAIVGGASVTTVNPASIDYTFNPGSVAGDIERNVDIAGELKKKEEDLKKTEGGEFSADALQQKVFAEYLKAQNPGLSEDDAERGAKYVFARTLADGVMRQDIASVTEDLFGEAKDVSVEQEEHDIDVINGVAKAVGITAHERNNWFMYFNPQSPEWSRASYKQLCTAYFALKQVYDDPSHRLHLGRWKFVKEQMQTIAKLLSTRYVQALVDDYSGNIDPEERKKLKQGKAATAATVEQILSGAPPEKYKGKIEKVLKDVEGKMFWKGTALKSVWEKTKAGTVRTGKVLKYGSWPVWYPAGKAIGLGGKGVGLVAKHPWMTAGFVAGSILAGPVAAALALAVANKVGGNGGGGSQGH